MSCANPTSKGPCGGRLHQEKRFDPIIRLSQVQPPNKPLRSFFIADILNARGSEPRTPYTATPAAAPTPGTGPRQQTGAIKRPWDDNHSNRSGGYSTDVEDDEEVDDDDEEEISVDDEKGQSQLTTKSVVCPLDALLKMTSKTFDSQDKSTSENESSKRDSNGLGGLNSKSQSSKKRRKSRTAFTNKQIYELEKRFLYQKYLTPVDRDEIAQSLGLTNAQVITWFQNRRAKLKRDMEELKADVTAAKSLGPETAIAVIGGLDDLQQGKATLPPQPKNRHSRRKDGRNATTTTTTVVMMSCGESNDSSSTPGSAARSPSTPGSAEESSSTGSAPAAAAAAAATGAACERRVSTEDALTTTAGCAALTPADEKDSRAVDKFKDGD